jgi:hypothetical protein
VVENQKSERTSSNSGDRWHVLRLCRQKQQRFAVKNQSNAKSWRSSSAIGNGLSNSGSSPISGTNQLAGQIERYDLETKSESTMD